MSFPNSACLVAYSCLILANVAFSQQDEKTANQKFVDDYYQRIEEELKQTQARLERLQEVLKQREAVELGLRDGIPDKGPPVVLPAEALEERRAEEKGQQAEQRITLDFENKPWKEVIRAVVPKGVTFTAVSYPEGSVTIKNFQNLTPNQALDVLQTRLKMKGFDIWETESHWQLVRHLDEKHPLQGTWRIVTLLQDGKRQSVEEFEKIVFVNDRFSLYERGDNIGEQIYFAVDGSNCFWTDEGENIRGIGSFQMKGDRATLLLALLEQEQEGVTVIRLERF